jgi:hypothetical protein
MELTQTDKNNILEMIRNRIEYTRACWTDWHAEMMPVEMQKHIEDLIDLRVKIENEP